MQFQLASVLIFLLVACAFLAVTLLVGRVVRPSTPNAGKGAAYECGEQALGGGWFNFNPRFYLVALVFLIFDVEVVFIYPVAVVFRRWLDTSLGAVALLEIALFVAVLAVGLAYVWRRGDLEWLRALRAGGDRTDAGGDAAPARD
jgi:NADH-quinone oxidoreductase subunit A